MFSFPCSNICLKSVVIIVFNYGLLLTAEDYFGNFNIIRMVLSFRIIFFVSIYRAHCDTIRGDLLPPINLSTVVNCRHH